MMKHLLYSWTLVITCLLLNSCTGTTADSAPLFVIAGVQESNGTNPRVVVVQDQVLNNLGDGEPRFTDFSAQPLAAPARAFDVVDETFDRSELVVLSRSPTRDATTQIIPAYLDFFNSRGLTPTQPDTFAPSRTQLDLRAATFTYPFPLTDLCPIDLEVTRDGNYALFFNSPRVCNPAKLEQDNVIVVLSIARGSAPRVVSSLTRDNNTKPLITSSVVSGTPISSGMFLDPSTDTLYYLRRSVSTLELRSLGFSTYTVNTNPENDPALNPLLASINTLEFRDLTKIAGSIAILGTTNYLLAPQTFTENSSPRATTTVTARSQTPRAFAQDVTGTRFLFLDDNERLVYHADPATPANTVTEVEGRLSAWNTTDDFLYIADTDQLETFDTRPLEEGDTNLGPLLDEQTCETSPALCVLDNPSALSWVQGILLPTTEP
jgi:hypothetical protein